MAPEETATDASRRSRRRRLGRSTAESDRDWTRERSYDFPTIMMEQEPGSSGATVIDHYRREVLSEFTIRGERATGTKEARAMPVAARAEAGELVLCRAAWNEAFLDELVAFPHASHDDQVDALSAAFGYLAKRHERPIPMPVSITHESYWRDDSYAIDSLIDGAHRQRRPRPVSSIYRGMGQAKAT